MANLANVLRAYTFIVLGGFLFGYMIGINSNIITEGQLLCTKPGSPSAGTWTSWGYGHCYYLSSFQQGLLSSISLIGACIASLICFRYADSLGRKLEVQISGTLYLVGACLTAGSPTLLGVFVGLFIYGLGIGFAMHAAPIYIAEISPPEVRGTLVSCKEVIIVLGIFVGFLMGWVCPAIVSSNGWRMMIICPALVAVVILAGTFSIAESPRFLVLKSVLDGKFTHGGEVESNDPARVALQYFRGSFDVEEELKTMYGDVYDSLRGSLENDTLLPFKSEQPSLWEPFMYTRPLIVGCGLVFLQQVTGQPSVLYFATNIFKAAGFADAASAQSVGLGLVKLVATLATVWTVDRYGRRPLLMIGISMMTVALALTVLGFHHAHCPGAVQSAINNCDSDSLVLPKFWANLTVAALMLYVSGYQVGFGPISWLIISEVFPLKVRGSALAVAAIVNFGSNIAVTISTPIMMAAFSPAWVFSVFGILSLGSIAFVFFVVPETNGKSLEEIEVAMKAST